MQNIFEPFYTKSRTGKGTGLGLFISHQIIDQHGGTIEATSPGPGRAARSPCACLCIEAGDDRRRRDDARHGTGRVLPFPAFARAA